MKHAHQKEVVFIRHGKPLSAHNDIVNAAEYTKWVRNYNSSPLDPASNPSTKTHLKNSYIIVSPLLRARLSAEHYGVQHINETCSDLKEMDIPYYKMPFKLKAWHWVLLCRALWFAGLKGRFESFGEAKNRTIVLADHVDTLSSSHNRIVLFGHGMTNYFTRRQLTKKGWHLKTKSGDFWGITTLVKSSD